MSTSPLTTTYLTVGMIVQIITNDPNLSIFIAGMAGGGVRWYYKEESFFKGMGSVLVGGVCAKYLGPLSISLIESVTKIEIADSTGQMGAFLMGLGGVAIIGLILDIFEGKQKAKPDE